MQIIVKHLSFSYSPKTIFRTDALRDVTLDIEEGSFLGLIGATGSGKSTFVQHLNGLIRVQLPKPFEKRKYRKSKDTPDVLTDRRGNQHRRPVLIVDGIDVTRKYSPRELRGRCGMVFQYPEYQLFDETVLKDVGFGPRNLGMSDAEADEAAREAIRAVGLDLDAVGGMSPFELSGGQKRRAAIAGVIAMKPEILILDEPTAGLDPRGKREIMELLLRLKGDFIKTIIMISHDMDEISAYADTVAVLNGGALEFCLPPAQLYRHAKRLIEIGLDVPLAVRLSQSLREQRGIEISSYTPEGFIEETAQIYARKSAAKPSQNDGEEQP